YPTRLPILLRSPLTSPLFPYTTLFRSSSSSHQSLNVLITPPEGHIPHFRCRDWVFGELEEVPREKPADSIVRSRIEQIVGSYNRDTSNLQVDYFNRRFYEHIQWADGVRLEDAE